MSSSLLFPDEDGNSVPEKNSTLMGHFEKLPNFEFKNSKNLSKVIKFIKRKQHQITIHNTKIFNKALDCIFMNYILMCSSKIQEFEPDIKPEEEQDFFKYALSFLNHVFTFIPREEILRGYEHYQSCFAILIGCHIEIASKITDFSDDEIIRSTIALLVSTEKYFDKRYYTQILLFSNKLLHRPKAAEVLYAHILKLPKAPTVVTDEHFSRIVYLGRNILNVIPQEKRQEFKNSLQLFLPDENIAMGVFSEHLPAFNFSSGAMEACLAVKNKNQFGTALRRHVRNAAKRLKVSQPHPISKDNLVNNIDADIAIVEKYIPNIDLCETRDELKGELSWFKYSKSVFNMAKNKKDEKVDAFVSLISDDEDDEMSDNDSNGRKTPIPSPEPMEVQSAPPPTPIETPTSTVLFSTVQNSITTISSTPEPMEVQSAPPPTPIETPTSTVLFSTVQNSITTISSTPNLIIQNAQPTFSAAEILPTAFSVAQSVSATFSVAQSSPTSFSTFSSAPNSTSTYSVAQNSIVSTSESIDSSKIQSLESTVFSSQPQFSLPQNSIVSPSMAQNSIVSSSQVIPEHVKESVEIQNEPIETETACKSPEPMDVEESVEEPQSQTLEKNVDADADIEDNEESDESSPQMVTFEKTDREQIAALPREIAETVNTLIDIYENSRSPKVPLDTNLNHKSAENIQNEEVPEIINGSPESQIVPVMDEIVPIITNNFSYNSDPVHRIVDSVSRIVSQPITPEVVPEMHITPEEIAPVIQMNHDQIITVVVTENEPLENDDDNVKEEDMSQTIINQEFCQINHENVVLHHEEIVAFTEADVCQTQNLQSPIKQKQLIKHHQTSCFNLCDKKPAEALKKTSKTYQSKRKTKAELKSMEIDIPAILGNGSVGPVLNQIQFSEFSMNQIQPNIPYLEQRLEHSSSEESIYDGSSFYATLDSDHVAEYVECENGIVQNSLENTISPSLKPSQSPPHTGSVDVAGSPKGETSEEEFVGFTYFYSPHKITRDISLGNSQFSPYVRLDRNVVARELEKMGKLKNERSHSMDSKFLRRSTRKKSACFIDYMEDDTSQSNSEPEIKKPTIKQRRKTCSWDTDEPYNPSQSNINKRRKTICKELDKAKSPRKRSKTPSKPEKQEAPISPIFETIPIKQKSSVSMKIPSFKSQSLFTFKDPVIELSWTEKMLTAPPTNFGKIQQRRKTLLSSPLLTFQNSSDLRDLDTNSNDSVILISSDQKRSTPSTSNQCHEQIISFKSILKAKDKCSKKDRVDKKQKLKNIEKSEGQLFKKLKGGESPPSIFSRQQNTEPSIESAVLGFKRLHLKTSNEPEEEPKKPVIQSCLKSVTSQNAPTVKKTKSISFKQPIEEKREIERVKKRRKTLHPTDSLQKPSIFDFSEKSSNGDFLKIKKRRQSSFKQTSNSSNPQVKKKKSKKIELVNELIGPPTPPPSTSTLSNPKKLSNQHKESLSHSKVTFNHKESSSHNKEKSKKSLPELHRIDLFSNILGSSSKPKSSSSSSKGSVKFKRLPPERAPSKSNRLPRIELVNELIEPPTPPQIPIYNQENVLEEPSQQMTPEAYREFHLQRTLDNFEMLTENSEHHNRITHRRNTTTDSKNGPSSSRRILTRRLSTVPDDNGVSSTVDIEESLSSPMTSPATGIEDRTPPTPDR